jgi:GNAT superfamily N-acetyltransferase
MEYLLVEGIPEPALLAAVIALHRRVFGSDDDNGTDAVHRKLQREMHGRAGVLFVLARAVGALVGYKIGYERKPDHYYSWLGGVDPAHRGRGIARELMDRQHAWCARHNYTVVRTITGNRYRAMLILDLRAGFDVIGVQTNPDGHLRIVLEKRLEPAAAT